MFDKLLKLVKKNPYNEEYLNDCLNALRNIFKTDVMKAMICSAKLKGILREHIKNKENINFVYQSVFKILVLETPYSLDSYFQALEWQRPLKERFYYPRRQKLIELGIIGDLEDLLIRDVIDEYFLSLPVRVGKTTLANFAMSWVIGMNSEGSNLYSSSSGVNVNAFYKGVKELITDKDTYCWSSIFPNAKFDENSMCSAKETWLDVGRDKRYHSLTCRSIDGTLNGACDCNSLLVADDLVSGIEEALNPERMDILWKKTNNDLLTRAKEKAKKWHIGTRWSIRDPQGVRLQILEEEGNTRYRVRKCPALNEKDESNFDYAYNVGFSTKHYIDKRQSYLSTNDEASWRAIYQQEPIERKGILFPSEKLNTWNGEFAEGTKIDRIFAPVDVAFGGGDNLSMPVIYKIGKKKYVVDVVYDSRDKSYTEPKVVDMTLRHKIGTLRFEKNNGGEFYKDDVAKMLEKANYKCNIKAIPAPNTKSKEIKIFETAPDIIQDFIFLERSKRSDEYNRFMVDLCSYTVMGKKQRDDAPDSLAQAVQEDREMSVGVVEIFQRPF